MTPADRRLLRARLDVALWPVPAVLTVLAAVLAELVSRVPSDTAQALLILPDFGPNTALAVLSAIATGMLTFTGLVAAVILLALQFGASQLSPRLLRTLVGRSPAKWALGASIAAFVYSLLVIGEVSPQGSSASVPALAVEIAIVLVIAAIGASLYLLHATTQALRVARVATEVAHQGMSVIEQTYPRMADEAQPAPPPLPEGAPAVIAWPGPPGVIAGIETRALMTLASRENLVVELIPAVGDSVESGSGLMHVWGTGATDQLIGTVVVSDERTFGQDPMFALRILVDVAIRALSHAINDPTTATQCLHRIQALLAAVGCRVLEADVQTDGSGAVRVIVPSPSWDDYMDLGLSEIRHAGAGQFQVARRMRALLDHLDDVCPESRHATIARHRAALDESIQAAFPLDADLRFASAADAQGVGGARRSV
jgi:uncharacterized membrane protein